MIYESVCFKCGAYHEYIRSVQDRNDVPECCGVKTEKRVLSVPSAHFDVQPWESFISPATGKLITSKAERQEDMKASGCRQWEGMKDEKSEAARRKQYNEEAQDKALDHAVRTAWAQLSPSKKAQALSATN
jgi:hypothetical protein